MHRIGWPFLLLIALPAPWQAARAETAPDWQRSEQVEYQVQADGRYTARQSFDITVNTEAALRVAAEQSFGWSAGLEDVQIEDAYTSKPDGTRIPVGRQGVLDQVVGVSAEYPSFSDWQARSIVFPDVQPGDTLHYVLRRRAVAALFPGQFTADLHIGPAPHVTQADITLSLPSGMQLGVDAPGLAEDAPVAADGRVTRHWHLAPSTAPGPVGFAASTFPDYAALGTAYAAQANAGPSDATRALAARLTKTIPDRHDQAEALYDYVSTQIRYVGLQLGSGRVVPRSPDAVLASGYGDCKDHVVLLQALLASVGIESVPALISTKPRYDLPQPPTLDVLDHVILYLPDFHLFADATSGYAPFGVLPIGEYGKPVILAGATGGRLDRVPELTPGQAWTGVHTALDVARDGTISGSTETEAGGPYAVALREIADGLGGVTEQLHRLGTPGTGSYSFSSPTALTSDQYAVSARFQLEDGLADAPDGRITPPQGATVMVRPGGFLVSETPVPGGHLCYAGRQSEIIQITLPDNRVPAELPPDVAVEAGYASYRAHWQRNPQGVSVARVFTVQSPHALCSPADYAAMQPALRAARLDLRSRLQLREITPPAPPPAMAMMKMQPQLRPAMAQPQGGHAAPIRF